MTKIVELRQDRNYIRNNFDGYKLSLDPVPLFRHDLSIAPHKASPSDGQYSFLHTEQFALQNLLIGDPWNRTTTYFVNYRGDIVRSSYDEQTGRSEKPQVVNHLPTKQRIKGDYNYSMRFISEKFVVVCDGINSLHLYGTGDRLKKTEWKVITSTTIITPENHEEKEHKRGYLLYDCRMDTIQEQKRISIAVGRVERIELTEEECASNSTAHFLHIHSCRWIQEENTWTFSIVETLESRGSLYYCAFEPRAESLIISSNRPWIFTSLKNHQQHQSISTMENVEKPQLHSEEVDNIQHKTYTWSQNAEEILLTFNFSTNENEPLQKSDYEIIPSDKKLIVRYRNEVIFDGEFLDKIDSDLTTWTLENSILQITLLKDSRSLRDWPSLLADGTGPPGTNTEHTRDSEFPINQQPIVNLEAPIEDCDFPMGNEEDDIKIERFHIGRKTITHTVLLGSMPPLFATSLRAGFPLAIVTRQDVDACLWLQLYNPSKPDEWTLRHEGNLHAFGYIQASKQQRKFIDCSPDLNYAVICESHRHIFLYKSQYDTANGLRKRTGGQISFGKQHLITLDDEVGEVLGMVTASSVITVLTERAVIHLQITS